MSCRATKLGAKRRVRFRTETAFADVLRQSGFMNADVLSKLLKVQRRDQFSWTLAEQILELSSRSLTVGVFFDEFCDINAHQEHCSRTTPETAICRLTKLVTPSYIL
jgi:hypothetical protein